MSESAKKLQTMPLTEGLTMNLVHLLFLHSLVKKLNDQDNTNGEYGNFLGDLIHLLEYHIDSVDDEKLKIKMKYNLKS